MKRHAFFLFAYQKHTLKVARINKSHLEASSRLYELVMKMKSNVYSRFEKKNLIS